MDVKAVIVHEGIHQAAFNTSLHSRIGRTPTWVVEGLATLFEPLGTTPGFPGRVAPLTGGQAFRGTDRVNEGRWFRFREFLKQRREDESLAEFIGSDRLFHTAAPDAYSQAWALSFYLTETRPKQYTRYLQIIAQRDPLKPYPRRARIDDFESAFGLQVELLEDDFLRFMDRLRE